MKGKSLEEKITDKLKEYDIKIFKISKGPDNSVIMAENFLASCSDNEIYLNFHISSKPSYAARITTILKDIKSVRNFQIGNDFVFDSDGKYLEGEEARKVFDEFHEKIIIDDWLDNQKTLYMLKNVDGLPC